MTRVIRTRIAARQCRIKRASSQSDRTYAPTVRADVEGRLNLQNGQVINEPLSFPCFKHLTLVAGIAVKNLVNPSETRLVLYTSN